MWNSGKPWNNEELNWSCLKERGKKVWHNQGLDLSCHKEDKTIYYSEREGIYGGEK